MSKYIKMYTALISCPSDVGAYINSIKKGVDRFNNIYGEINGIIVRTKYWLEDSFPESGGSGQELLNRQIVDTADIAIAVFWTKFGEPTEHFGSGTEEEIEHMISSGKQVFLYFLEKPISPSMLNSREQKKIENFKTNYRKSKKGMYFTVENEIDLESKVTEGLIHYFSNITSV